jgi:hypothetical protein
LADIKIATKILDDPNNGANQIDSNYAKLNRGIKFISPTSRE